MLLEELQSNEIELALIELHSLLKSGYDVDHIIKHTKEKFGQAAPMIIDTFIKSYKVEPTKSQEIEQDYISGGNVVPPEVMQW